MTPPLTSPLRILTVAAALWVSTPSSIGAQPVHGDRTSREVDADILAEIESADADFGFSLLGEATLNRQPPPIWPEGLEAFDGTEVEIIGFMTPFDDLENMHNFMLMSYPTGCFYCQPPSPLEVVFVRQAEDEAEYIYDPIRVRGTLRLWHEETDDSAHNYFLYVIDEATVEIYEGDTSTGG